MMPTSGERRFRSTSWASSVRTISAGMAKTTVAAATESGALRSVAGGGDTVSALRQAGVIDKLSYVSSAGGAFLEWLEGKTLSGVAALG